MKVDDSRSPPCVEPESSLSAELAVSAGLARQLVQGFPVSTHWALDLESLHPVHVLCGFWDPDSTPQACTESALPEPSPQHA